MEPVTLRTHRLLIRPLSPGDDADMLRIFSQERTMTYWSCEPLTSLEEARRMLQQEIECAEAGRCVNWALVLADSGAMIGKAGFFDYDKVHRRAEIGYVIDPAHWGRGLATEAVARVIEYAFDELRLHRIEADIDPGNEASLAVMEKFGFRREGYSAHRFFVHGSWHDSVILGLLEPDYRQKLSSQSH